MKDLLEVLEEQDEKYLDELKVMYKGYKYIARDKNGKLFIYKNKPGKEENTWIGISGYYHQLKRYVLPFIKWEDAEPYEIHGFNEEQNKAVNPDHYKQNLFETIDEMVILFGKDAAINFCTCNAWKYRSRADSSGKKEQDLKKANWYIEKVFALKSSVLYEEGRKTEEYNTVLKGITGKETLSH